MKPEQFIREFGLEKARDLLDQLHKLGCPDDMKITVINGMWQRTSNGFTYPELKRLVESLDIVRVIGPIEYTRSVVTNAPVNAIGYDTMYEGYFGEETKHYYENLRTFTIDQIKDAVAVHESIYGGGDD